MKKIVLPLFCLVTTLSAISQIPFQKGYIVLPSGDTTKGYIRRNTNAELAKSVEFRTSESGNSYRLFTVNNLTAFGFEDGDLFRAVQYTDPLDSNKYKKEFARFVLDGYYDVYAIAVGNLSNYLVQGKDTGYYLYDDVVSYFDTPVNKGLPERLGNYRNALAFLARKCERVNVSFDKIQFTEHDIVRVVNRINECYQSTSVVYHQKAKLRSYVLVHAGGFYIKDKLSQLSAGGEFRLYNPAVNRKLSYAVGLHYSKTVDINNGYNFLRQPVKTYQTTEIFSLPATIQYAFTERAVQPYVYVGFSAAYKKANYNSPFPDYGFQANYGVALVGGVGLEVYPLSFLAIRLDWRYELLLQYPSLGLAFRF